MNQQQENGAAIRSPLDLPSHSHGKLIAMQIGSSWHIKSLNIPPESLGLDLQMQRKQRFKSQFLNVHGGLSAYLSKVYSNMTRVIGGSGRVKSDE